MLANTTAPPRSEPAPDLTPNEAIAQLFEQHGDFVYRLGLRACGDEQSAEDLVQETFLRALKSWSRFEGRAKASTWLFRIATRACTRMRRTNAGEPDRLESFEALLPAARDGLSQLPASQSPEDRAMREELTAVVRKAAALLPPEFRFPFLLKEMFDFSLAEVADVLGIKEATVKTRLHRARLRIRKSIALRLPAGPAPESDHERNECLALLKAKQESLDRGAPFPVPDEELCQRCQSVFATLDLGREVCQALDEGMMPRSLRAEIERAVAP